MSSSSGTLPVVDKKERKKLLKQHLSAKLSPSVSQWENKYKAVLQNLRDSVGKTTHSPHHLEQSDDIEVIQEALTRGYQAILQEMLAEAIAQNDRRDCKGFSR